VDHTLYTYLVGLLPIAAGLGGAVLIRLAFSLISIHELRVGQDLALAAHRAVVDAEGNSTAAAPVPGSTDHSLGRIAMAPEEPVHVQRRGWVEWATNLLSQTALVIGAVVAVVSLLRR
jgi:hypothetical protein